MERYTIITERITVYGQKKWDLVVPNGPYNITEVQELMFKLNGSGYMNIITWEKFQNMTKNR